MKRQLARASVFAAALSCAGDSASQTPSVPGLPGIPMPEKRRYRDPDGEQRAAYQAARKAILVDLQRPSVPDWAGYYEGTAGFVHQEFLVSPLGPFAKILTSDVRFPPGTYGMAELVNGQFMLRLGAELHHQQSHAVVPGPYLLAWGEYRYAVEPEDMLVFVNAVNAAGTPRALCGLDGYRCAVMTRKTTAARLEAAQPVLPAPWNSYLLSQPVESRITQAGPRSTTYYSTYSIVKTVYQIDKGARAGLKSGMHLYFDRIGYKNVLTVLTVEADTALVEFSDSESASHKGELPPVGTPLSSLYPYRDWMPSGR